MYTNIVYYTPNFAIIVHFYYWYSPLCSCGRLEDAYHFIYFFTCTKYIAARNYLFNEIFLIENLNIVNTHVLLWGENLISNTDNEQSNIKNSGRFLIVGIRLFYIDISVRIVFLLLSSLTIYLLCTLNLSII